MSNADKKQETTEALASVVAPDTAQATGAYQCAECQKPHCEPARCSKCGACLYKNSTQVKDDTYPLFRCTLCNEVNFWD